MFPLGICPLHRRAKRRDLRWICQRRTEWHHWYWQTRRNRCDDSEKTINEINSSFVSDKLGRQHYRKLTAGPSLVKLRASIFDQSSGMTHANDILPILKGYVKDGKGIAFLKVDNGSDWNLHSLVNMFFWEKYGRTRVLIYWERLVMLHDTLHTTI